MLLERTRALDADLDRLERLRIAATHAETLETRRAQIDAAVAELTPLLVTLRLLKKHGIETAVPDAHARRLRTQLQRMADEYQRGPDTIVTWEGTRLFTELQTLSRTLREQLLQAWQHWTRTHGVSLDAALMDVLGGIPAFRPHISQIRRSLLKLQNAAHLLPGTDAAITDFTTTVREIEAEWQRLDGGNLSPGVTRFLKHAVAGGAALDLLTPEVFSWLHDHRIEGSFCVTVRSTH